MKEFLSINNYLKVLDISWNNIRPKGGINIFEALSYNDSLSYLDIS